jgi:hypothetical protein
MTTTWFLLLATCLAASTPAWATPIQAVGKPDDLLPKAVTIDDQWTKREVEKLLDEKKKPEEVLVNENWISNYIFYIPLKTMF